jgi:hypothetical protein
LLKGAMKITEQTTLAELQKYLKVCGDPFITLMSGHPHGSHPRHAIIHVPEVGTFHGGGATVAEALEAAFIEYRRATLPEGLKPYASPPPYSPTRADLCHGCGHRRDQHPNETGCQSWHDKP